MSQHVINPEDCSLQAVVGVFHKYQLDQVD